MFKIDIQKNESIDDALKRFKKECSKSGVIKEFKKRECYCGPSLKRKKKSEAAQKRRQKSRRGSFKN
ncbi:MAG: 30S ribosomal protein S21 [Clostridiales bacterium]|jgi:small subunit ribosomal protein S21|nr:30S ribosomal protein S21 [Clostridiales bacterium]